MKDNFKLKLAIILCIFSLIISIISIYISQIELQSLQQQLSASKEETSYYWTLIRKEQSGIYDLVTSTEKRQNRTIDMYKEHVDDVVNCIINQVW